MSWMKRWLWELIENGEVQYLITMGAPKWAVEEAEFYAKNTGANDSNRGDSTTENGF